MFNPVIAVPVPVNPLPPPAGAQLKLPAPSVCKKSPPKVVWLGSNALIKVVVGDAMLVAVMVPEAILLPVTALAAIVATTEPEPEAVTSPVKAEIPPEPGATHEATVPLEVRTLPL